MSEQITPDYPNEILDIVERKSYEWFKDLIPGDNIYLYSPTFKGSMDYLKYPFKYQFEELLIKEINTSPAPNIAIFDRGYLMIYVIRDGLRRLDFPIEKDPKFDSYTKELPYYYVSKDLI